jgi:hypothetical protein
VTARAGAGVQPAQASNRRRLPEQLAETAEAVALVKAVSVNALITESLSAKIARVKADKDLMAGMSKLLERDKELLHRLAQI